MKTAFFLKAVVLMCTASFLFACNETELDLNLENEFTKKQEVSPQVDKETFVSLDKATEIADLFFIKHTEGNVSTRNGLGVQRGSASVEALMESGNPSMYIMNYPGGGFVIVSATKNYYPVLAYSDKNSFEITSEMNGVSDWLEETKEAIIASDAFNDSIKFAMQNLWKNYETADILPSSKTRGISYSSAELACWERCEELIMQYWSQGWNFMPLSEARGMLYGAGWGGTYEDLCYSANLNQSPINCSIIGIKDIYLTEQVGSLLTTQ